MQVEEDQKKAEELQEGYGGWVKTMTKVREHLQEGYGGCVKTMTKVRVSTCRKGTAAG